MNTLILGGDKRYYEIIEAFKNKKYNIDLVGYKNSGLYYLKYSIFKANFIKFILFLNISNIWLK